MLYRIGSLKAKGIVYQSYVKSNIISNFISNIITVTDHHKASDTSNELSFSSSGSQIMYCQSDPIRDCYRWLLIAVC